MIFKTESILCFENLNSFIVPVNMGKVLNIYQAFWNGKGLLVFWIFGRLVMGLNMPILQKMLAIAKTHVKSK